MWFGLEGSRREGRVCWLMICTLPLHLFIWAVLCCSHKTLPLSAGKSRLWIGLTNHRHLSRWALCERRSAHPFPQCGGPTRRVLIFSFFFLKGGQKRHEIEKLDKWRRAPDFMTLHDIKGRGAEQIYWDVFHREGDVMTNATHKTFTQMRLLGLWHFTVFCAKRFYWYCY